MKLHVEPLPDQDLPRLRTKLAGDGLPVADIGRAPIRFFRALTEGGAPAGYGGLEIYATDALLRSVFVEEIWRGYGGGEALVHALMQEAAEQGVRRLWLLTTTAEGFFRKLGFTPAPRTCAPAAIRATEEFAWHCPDTAVCMTLGLITV